MTVPGVFSHLARDPSLAERVTEAMLDSIQSGKLSSGDRLPSERELCDQFGVSRTVVREAIRGLQAKGLVEVRAGRGAVVLAPQASQITESIRLYVRGGGTDTLDVEKISEVRTTLEVRMVELACTRATDDDFALMQAALSGMAADEEMERASEHDVEFHRLIAAATKNILFEVLLESMGDVLLEIRRRSLARPGRRDQAVEEHRLVLDALVARDVERARAAMEHHLEDSRTIFVRES